LRGVLATDKNKRLHLGTGDQGVGSRVNDIVIGHRGITADTAFRLARYFGTSAEFWVNLRSRYDLDAVDRKLRRRIEREVTPRAA
jgi:antitoxin HigA-1